MRKATWGGWFLVKKVRMLMSSRSITGHRVPAPQFVGFLLLQYLHKVGIKTKERLEQGLTPP
jgi:hypothetical protein